MGYITYSPCYPGAKEKLFWDGENITSAVMEERDLKSCALCLRTRPRLEMEEVLIREAVEPKPLTKTGKSRKITKGELLEEAQESGMTPGRKRSVWYRCADDPCRTFHERLFSLPALVLPEPPRYRLPPMEFWGYGHVVEVPRWNGEEMEPTIVGKVLLHPQHGQVFLHAESGTQYHHKTRCPAPFDTILLEYLQKVQAISYLLVYDRREEKMWRTTVKAATGADEELSGGRRRRYLPEEEWGCVAGVVEKVYHGNRHYYAPSGTEIVASPYFRSAKAIRVLWGIEG